MRKKLREKENLLKIINSYQQVAEEYKTKYDNARKKQFKDYDYAILVKDTEVELWNNGKFEQRVSGIEFNYEGIDSIPTIIIKKV